MISTRRVAWLSAVVSLLLIGTFVSGATQAHALRVAGIFPASEKYPITNSGYQGFAYGLRTVAWVDNDRALFLSSGPLLKSGEPSRSGSKDLYLWNTRSGKIRKYAESVSGFCFAEGMLRFWGKTDTGLYEYAGRFGEERKREYTNSNFPARSGWHLNPHTCNYYRDERLPKGKGLFFRPLRKGDGYLGGGGGIRGNFAIYLPEGGDEYTRLPVPTRVAPVTYSQLARAYVLRETPPIDRRDPDHDIRFWLFRSDVIDVDPIVIPAGPWLKGYLIFVSPTPAGVVFASATTGKSDMSGRPTTGAGGVYVLANGRAKRIMAGYPISAAITPNGCRVIVSIVPRFMAGKPVAVDFVDLCSTDR